MKKMDEKELEGTLGYIICWAKLNLCSYFSVKCKHHLLLVELAKQSNFIYSPNLKSEGILPICLRKGNSQCTPSFC